MQELKDAELQGDVIEKPVPKKREKKIADKKTSP
jgi:hypothetical protein